MAGGEGKGVLIADRPWDIRPGAVEVDLERLVEHDGSTDAQGEERRGIPFADSPDAAFSLADQKEDDHCQDERRDEDPDRANKGEAEHDAGQQGLCPAVYFGLEGEIESRQVSQFCVQRRQQSEYGQCADQADQDGFEEKTGTRRHEL